MAISVDCSGCGKTLKAKDSAAGKTAKCPSCGELITIPLIDEVYDAEEAGEPDAEFAGVNSYDTPAIPDEGRIACSACGEMIAAKAKKCRHCGEIFDAELKRKGRGNKSSGSRGGHSPPLADLGKRFIGAMAEGSAVLLFAGPGLGMILAADLNAPQPNEALMIVGVIALALGGLTFVGLNLYLIAVRSQTIGKYLVSTQITDYQTGEPAGFVKIFFIRILVNGLLGNIPLYGIIDILFIFGEERRCIHDYLAGTYVADIS